MAGVVRRGQYYVTRYTTGPQDLLLMLDMEIERINDPFVVALSVCPINGQPEDSTVRAAVLRGADEANEMLGTSWYPLEIKYWYSGYDNARCSLMSCAAFDVVKALAERGPDGIEVVAESE